MNEMRRRWGLTAAALVGLIAVPAQAPAAPAKDGDVLVRGTCTGRSTSKLKLSDDDGRMEVEVEVDQNRNGVPWTILLRRDGVRVATAVRVTRPPSGSFELRRVIANGAGTDVVSARAMRRSGEVCSARGTFRI
jgi:hypothetical protein